MFLLIDEACADGLRASEVKHFLKSVDQEEERTGHGDDSLSFWALTRGFSGSDAARSQVLGSFQRVPVAASAIFTQTLHIASLLFAERPACPSTHAGFEISIRTQSSCIMKPAKDLLPSVLKLCRRWTSAARPRARGFEEIIAR